MHDPDLNHLRNITYESMSEPSDVKVSHNRLTLEGDKLHSLITRGEGMNLICPFCFCLDHLANFIISDFMSHSIRVFSPEGNLLHTIGSEGHQPGMMFHPLGLAVTPNKGLVCVSGNENYGLQIFC